MGHTIFWGVNYLRSDFARVEHFGVVFVFFLVENENLVR